MLTEELKTILSEDCFTKINSHKWIIKHDRFNICHICGLEMFEYLIKYPNLNCNEICIKQIIE